MMIIISIIIHSCTENLEIITNDYNYFFAKNASWNFKSQEMLERQEGPQLK